jgi:hypothetical protein
LGGGTAWQARSTSADSSERSRPPLASTSLTAGSNTSGCVRVVGVRPSSLLEALACDGHIAAELVQVDVERVAQVLDEAADITLERVAGVGHGTIDAGLIEAAFVGVEQITDVLVEGERIRPLHAFRVRLTRGGNDGGEVGVSHAYVRDEIADVSVDALRWVGRGPGDALVAATTREQDGQREGEQR